VGIRERPDGTPDERSRTRDLLRHARARAAVGASSFGRKTAFDNIIVIILGAVLSRPLVGASPFWPCVAGSTVLSLIHRLIGIAKGRWSTVERIVAGRVDALWHDGRLEHHKMARHEISVSDLDAAARSALNVATHDQVPEIRIETNGELTVVSK
jgi:uncharacterized membrane protein YcaP (DUF421 family)